MISIDSLNIANIIQYNDIDQLVMNNMISESIIRKNISYHNMACIDWDKIVRSSLPLSNDFIAMISKMIDWKNMSRPMSESMVRRFKRFIVDWDAQLYGEPRTIEFIIDFKHKFNWKKISHNLPYWFSEYHMELLEDELDWEPLTPFAIETFSINRLCMIIDKLDWSWITDNNIPSEEFATRFLNNIMWDRKYINTKNLSTEFIHDVYLARKSEYEFQKNICSSPLCNRFSILFDGMNLDTFKYKKNIVLGCSMSLIFFRKHFMDINIDDLRNAKLIDDEILDEMLKELL